MEVMIGLEVTGNMDIVATNEIWNFVSKYNRNGLINCSSTIDHQVFTTNPKRLVKLVDILGKETFLKKNQINILFMMMDL